MKGALATVVSLLIVTVGVSIAVPVLSYLAGVLVLLSAAIGIVLVNRTQRVVSIVLIGIGVCALGVALWLGHRLTLEALLSLNQNLIAMLAAVSFIQIVAAADQVSISRLTGAMAVWRTALATHLLGSVINVSAINIVGDHLGSPGRMSMPNALLLSRAFSAGAFWSPFWAASAAAAAYAPGAKVNVLVFAGLCAAAVALAFSISGVVRSFGPELEGYRGYVLSWRILRIPLVLMASVLAAHALWPDLEIPNIVLVGSMAITVVVLLFRSPARTMPALVDHTVRGLPNMRGEITLFAAAGVLAVGLGALFQSVQLTLPFTEFTVVTAWCCTLVMTLMSLVGVHPVISIAAVAVIVAPLHPEPTLYAMASMIAWAGSATVGPVSGLNVFLNGRFGIDNFAVARRNLPYLAVVLALAWPILYLVEALA